MSNLIQLLQENQRLKNQLNKLKQINNLTPYINDNIIKGGYHVVKTIVDRDNIDCCYRKLGMKVLVVGNDLSFKEYILKTNNCKENIWEKIDVTVEENEVFLTEDYSELSENLTTQKELNLVLKQLILNLQTDLTTKLDKGTYTGDVSDLKSLIDTKADLDGGKVPKAQSQPSTIVMNNSTYVITFTDATGAVQTIDLPLESLFKDANYNSSTKSLIITLQDGTTRTIPLSDLVDLPEIVLSTSNPAVTPTTGQKVYFNTSSGKVWFNAGGNWSGGYSLINTITTDVTSTTTVGAINAGDIIPAGTTIQELTELLLNKTFYPTFVNPTFGLTNNAGLREVGSSFSVTLTFNFNRGQILGKLDNGIWNPTMLQDYRAGIATSYLLNGVSGSNNSASFNVTTILGTNTLTGSVTYGIGTQPKDSKNNNFESPFPAGTSPIQSTSFEGIYPYFYYKSTSPITPAIMQSAIANGQATKVLASSTGTITIPFEANGEYIAVAYPATSTTKTIWYVNALDNGVIPGGLLGGVNTLPCNSPTNLWSNVNFKIHVSAGLITQPNPIQLKNS